MSATIIEELVTLLGFEVDKKALKEAEAAYSNLKNVALGVSAAFAGIGVAAVAIVKDTIAAGAAAYNTAQRLGTTVEGLQELQIAAQLADVDAGSLTSALEKLSKAAYEASQGEKEQSKAFADLRIKVRDSKGELKTSDVLFSELADRMEKIPNAGKRVSLAMGVIGKSAGALIPLLRQGSAGIEELRARARSTGAIISAEDAKNADELEDSIDLLTTTVKGFGRVFASVVIGKIPKAFEKLLQKNRELVNVKIREWAERGSRAFEFIVKHVGQFTLVVNQGIAALGGWKNILLGISSILGFYLAVQIGKVVKELAELSISLGSVLKTFLTGSIIPALWGAAFLALIAIIAIVIQDLTSTNSLLKELWENPIDAKESPLYKGLHTIVQVIKFITDGVKDATKFISDLYTMANPNAAMGAQDQAARDVFGNPRNKTSPSLSRTLFDAVGGGNLGGGTSLARGFGAYLNRPSPNFEVLRGSANSPPLTVNLQQSFNGNADPRDVLKAAKSGIEAGAQKAIDTLQLQNDLGRTGNR